MPLLFLLLLFLLFLWGAICRRCSAASSESRNGSSSNKGADRSIMETAAGVATRVVLIPPPEVESLSLPLPPPAPGLRGFVRRVGTRMGGRGQREKAEGQR